MELVEDAICFDTSRTDIGLVINTAKSVMSRDPY